MARGWLMLIAIGLIPGRVAAQRALLDFSAGRTGAAWRVSAAAGWTVSVGPLTVGGGPRLTHYGGDAASYRTHDVVPSGLASRIRLAPGVWSLNLFVLGDVGLWRPVGVGANLDLAGVATGKSRRVGSATLEPARWSLFRYGDNDRGSLNSEFYLRVRVATRLVVRAGASHYVTGYRVRGSGSARYLRFDTVPFVALAWVP
jgi:hypothetical protein